MFGTSFPPRPPIQPIAAVLDTGALAEDHVTVMQAHIAKVESEEPSIPPKAEAVGASDDPMTGGPQPMAEAVTAGEASSVAPGAGSPPRAEAFVDAPVAA
eukprot:13689404-Alexandrium_andersonii.AAC.1